MPTKDKLSTSKKPSINLWHGENMPLLQFELDFWQEEFKKRHPQSVIEKIDREDDKILERLSQVLNSAGLFSQSKLVILYNFAVKSDDASEYVHEILDKISADVFLIFVEEKTVRKTNKLFKKLEKLAKDGRVNIKEFINFSSRELESWILNQAKKMVVKLSPLIAGMLASLVGNDFLRYKQELAKLASFKEGKEITSSDLDLLVSRKVDEDAFAVIDAIGRRDFKQALNKLEEQLAADLSPQSLVGTLAWHLRVLWQVRDYLDDHKRATPKEIAMGLKIHPFVVNKVLVQIPYYTVARLQNLYNELSGLDVKLKSSKLSPPVLFGLFISHLANSNNLGK